MNKKVMFIVAFLILCTGLFALAKGLQNQYAKGAEENAGTGKASYFTNNVSNNTSQDNQAEEAATSDKTQSTASADTKQDSTANSNAKGTGATDKTTPNSNAKDTGAAAPTTPQPKPNLIIIDAVSNKVILSTRVDFNNATASDATVNALKAAGIGYKMSQVGSSVYFSMIGGLYERKAGPLSGWCYYVNGSKPSEGSGSDTLKEGDTLEWKYLKDGLSS